MKTKIELVKEFVFQKPEEWVHIREIARNLKISPNTVRNVIKKLLKEEIVENKKSANLFQIRANFENESYKTEKKIFNLLKIYESGIINYLYDYYSPSTIILFGSYSRGEDLSTSDIDIGIITPKKNQPELKNFEKKLKRKVNLSLFVKKEVSEEFFTNIINGIVLKGVLK
ncbi:hypothetical protein COT60_00385 [Candidatus Pacearchaeota archaeon CG09_land_8_20_14_0_10_30_9]|nr:MAG: hypothetical protein COV77_00955 [Candidatus Pacearchaeota archaeon CG11_big_fil_rev_8_21_14_0_20_30_13]PIO01449.1 MAG: hypothetical protein COT60_00385 [Candidatus Pacearchaeota archaeon CG09_land_8_20_14_0_10_30_9]PJA71180.1 MAG: hypothetical protein CO153_02955 [Candidatus Pacearchaeota archaeon CG_4_9_14_3_um_filter_30_11]